MTFLGTPLPRVKRFRTSDEKQILQQVLEKNPDAFLMQARLILGGFRTFEDPSPRLGANGNYINQSHVDLRDLKAWIRQKVQELTHPQAPQKEVLN